MKEKILELSSQGLSPRKIAKILGISRFKVRYYTVPGEMEKVKIRGKISYSKKFPTSLYQKIKRFLRIKIKKNKNIIKLSHINSMITNKIVHFHKKKQIGECMFTKDDIYKKFGKITKCYLTGESINIDEPRTYEFDHIIPASKGGDNSIDNLGICTKAANRAKHDLSPNEFFDLCIKILMHNGYNISKITDKVV